MDKEQEDKGFTIVDKRRFDSSGNTRAGKEGAATEQQAHTQGVAAGSAAQQSAPQGAVKMDELPQITFSTFVMSLATQVMAQLGELSLPEGVKIEKDLDAARQTIDIINLLQEKTKGNLDQAEAQLIEEALHSVRISFVRVSRAGK